MGPDDGEMHCHTWGHAFWIQKVRQGIIFEQITKLQEIQGPYGGSKVSRLKNSCTQNIQI